MWLLLCIFMTRFPSLDWGSHLYLPCFVTFLSFGCWIHSRVLCSCLWPVFPQQANSWQCACCSQVGRVVPMAWPHPSDRLVGDVGKELKEITQWLAVSPVLFCQMWGDLHLEKIRENTSWRVKVRSRAGGGRICTHQLTLWGLSNDVNTSCMTCP